MGNMSLRRWQKGNKNFPGPHYVPGSVLGARNTVVNNTHRGQQKCGTTAQESGLDQISHFPFTTS